MKKTDFNIKNAGLIPLINFAVIDAEYPLYRSAQPLHGYQYRWLQDVLGLKLIYNLREEENIDQQWGIQLSFGVITYPVVDHTPPSLEIANKFIKDIKEHKGTSSLLHCQHGHGRTSTFTVLARIALGWTVEAAIKEEEEKFHYNFKHLAQKQFLLDNFGHKHKGIKVSEYA